MMWTATIGLGWVVLIAGRRVFGSAAQAKPPGYRKGHALKAVPAARARLRRKSDRVGHLDDLLELVQALTVGITAGLSLQTALQRARLTGSARSAVELETVLRDARQVGLSVALSRAQGATAPLLHRLARAQVSGAPLAATVIGFAAEERETRRSAQVEAARRLPVRLTIPLALLVLPGFVLLTVGPAAIGSLGRLLGPLLP